MSDLTSMNELALLDFIRKTDESEASPVRDREQNALKNSTLVPKALPAMPALLKLSGL